MGMFFAGLFSVAVGAGLLVLTFKKEIANWLAERSGPSEKDSSELAPGIPRPEYLLCNMLALQVAKLPPDDRYTSTYSHVPVRLEAGSRTVELRYYPEYGSVYFENDSLKPNAADQATLLAELRRLHLRSVKAQQVLAEQKSQDESLDLLQSLVGGISDPAPDPKA